MREIIVTIEILDENGVSIGKRQLNEHELEELLPSSTSWRNFFERPETRSR